MNDDLYRSMAAEPYEHRGILNSEMALIIHICRRLGITRFIESGRARAQSTYMLGKYLPGAEIHSIELRQSEDEAFGRTRVAGMKNVTLHYGDGAILLPDLAALLAKPTAVLCDGPKGMLAIEVLEDCFRYSHVRIGFIHDMRKLDHGNPTVHRPIAEERFPKHLFSDDPRFVEISSWMDANALKAGGPCGPQWEAQFGSYGPTIGAFFNPQQ